jgi:hypothetical protein
MLSTFYREISMNLLLSVAGMSTRFPNMKPKWLLTNPNGNLMIIEAILGLDLDKYNKIYIIALDEHLQKFKFISGIKKQFMQIGYIDKLEFIILNERTASQPETVSKAIVQGDIKGEIYIKDSDNYFIESRQSGNFISTFDLNDMDLVHAKNKSYVVTNDQNIVLNIVEKRVLSSTFNVGGYGFDSANKFVEYYNKLKDFDNLYISHVIYKMMLDGVEFQKSDVKKYIDWGTLKEWNMYRAQYSTLFINIDGVLVKDSDEFFEPVYGSTGRIDNNVDTLNKLYNSGKVNVILTTSRKEEYKEITVEQLNREGVKYHQIIFNLNQGKKVIVNDYSPTNPYKSCDAINVRNNSDDLKEMLEDSLGISI